MENIILNDGSNPALRVTGDHNKFFLGTNTANEESTFINDNGNGNYVSIGSLTSTVFNAARRLAINKPRPDAWMMTGAFATSGLASTPFLNYEDLFIVPSDIHWTSPPTEPAITKDTTLESGEYVTIPAPGGAQTKHFTRQNLKIGINVPKVRCRVYVKIRAASGTPTQTFNIFVGASNRGSSSLSLTTSWQVLFVDTTIDAASDGEAFTPTFNNTSGSQAVDIAWIAIRPIPVDLVSRVGADVGNNAKALTVGVDEMTQVWNTAISADRAVTLSTTGAYNGAQFTIIRTANATGGFNLNVGTGPLKAMGTAGSFCDVEYNGATGAWMLKRYGTL